MLEIPLSVVQFLSLLERMSLLVRNKALFAAASFSPCCGNHCSRWRQCLFVFCDNVSLCLRELLPLGEASPLCCWRQVLSLLQKRFFSLLERHDHSFLCWRQFLYFVGDKSSLCWRPFFSLWLEITSLGETLSLLVEDNALLGSAQFLSLLQQILSFGENTY
jgi:hypothetical protein